MENLDQDNNKNVSLSLIAEYGGSESDSEDTETQSNDHTANEDSDAPELSEMVLKNNIINACAHGPLSRSSILDDMDSTRHMIIDNCESGVVEYEVTEYRDIDSDSDSSASDSSSEVDSVKDIEEISSGDENEGGKSGKLDTPKVQGELGLDDLPPIEDLAISLPAQECTKIGTIASIVDRLVIVRAFPETPAVDIDSVLFLENGAQALGKVFDVFGPVTEPHYCVRFNSAEHAASRGAAPGAAVYIAPRTPHTNYVFLKELMRMKGSDASWLNDVEPPPHQIEYSDDEEERQAKRAGRERHDATGDGEASRSQPRKQERRPQRPSESSSRFGSGPSRARNPFAQGSRRPNPQRFTRPWNDPRTPPPHPNTPLMYPFDPLHSTPPPFDFHFGGSPRMPGPPMGVMGPYRQNMPMFPPNYCNMGPPQPQWAHGPPPPPGT